jgi:hypothetical protein
MSNHGDPRGIGLGVTEEYSGMFRKLFIAVSIAAITVFLTSQIALAEMDHDHDQSASDPRSPCQLQGPADDFHDQSASDPWSSCQLPGLADGSRDQRASNPWCRCQLPGLADDFRDGRSSPDATMTTSPVSPQ